MNDTFTLRDRGVIALHSLVANTVGQSPTLPFGLSYLIVTKDNESTIKESLKSIFESANEVVVVDGSKGKETARIVEDFSSNKVKYFSYRSGEKSWKVFTDSLNYGLNQCSFRWVFKWDADMIADPKGFQLWKERLESLNNKFFYEVDVARINSSKTLSFGGYEGRLFTQHPKIRYHWIPDRDSIVYPFWFKLLRWNEQYILHKEPK